VQACSCSDVKKDKDKEGPSLQGPGQAQGLDSQGQGQGLDSQGQGQGLHLNLLTASCS